MRRVAVVNSKGGSGKTTTAIHLAAAWAKLLAPAGLRVLLVDLDPAARASKWIAEPDGGELYRALADGGELAPLVRPTETVGLDVIPSSLHLRQAEQALVHEPGAAKALAEGMRGLPRQRWGLAVFDLPGAAAFCATLGLTAASDALVTIEGAVDLDDLPDVLRTLELVRKRLNHRLELSGVCQVRADLRTRLHRDLRAYLEADAVTGPVLLEAVIRSDVRLREAPSYRQTLYQYAPRSNAARDYRDLAAEYGRRLEILP